MDVTRSALQVSQLSGHIQFVTTLCPRRMVGVTYRSASSRPSNNGNKFVFPPQPQEQKIERGPAPSFKDKESYQELFKPLPKPEAIPQLVPFKVNKYKVAFFGL